MIDWKTIENFLRQWSYFNDDENFVRKLWKKFSRLRKKGFKKDLPTLTSREFFMVILLLSNHAVFLVQFGINLHLWVFKKALVQISAFWKIHKCNSELIPNWTRNSTTICFQQWTFFRACLFFKRDSFPDNCVDWTNENVSFGARNYECLSKKCTTFCSRGLQLWQNWRHVSGFCKLGIIATSERWRR